MGVVDTEERLPGGNLSPRVVRVGATMRRPVGPWTPAVHALLNHLHAVGFDGAPRVLGLDDAAGRSWSTSQERWRGMNDTISCSAQTKRCNKLARCSGGSTTLSRTSP